MSGNEQEEIKQTKSIKNGPVIKRLFNADHALVLIFILMAFMASLIIAALKIDSFRSWRYTSDMFTFDAVIMETARGYWGLDFGYGNAFGDHAYLLFLILTPLKYVLQTKFIYVLLLLGPIIYFVSSTVFLLATRRLTSTQNAVLMSIIYMCGFSTMYAGLHEKVYGMHPDTLSGFLAVSMTVLLVWKENNEAKGKRSAWQTAGALLFLFLFLILKEEMVLLAIAYFVVAYLFKRNRFNRNLVLVSFVAFAIDMAIIRVARTPFNRGNNTLFSNMLQSIQQDGLQVFFYNPTGNVQQQVAFWSVIVLCSILFAAITLRLTNRLNPYVAGLYVMGLGKLFFGLSVPDFNLVTWHNLPGLVMISSALLLQVLFLKPKFHILQPPILLTLSFISVFCFIRYDLPYVEEQQISNSNHKGETRTWAGELADLKKQVDPMRIVAIPHFSARQWVGYRQTRFPRGVTVAPLGIADYIVFPINNASRLNINTQGENTLKLHEIPPTFQKVDQTDDFILFRRISLTDEDEADRSFFYKFGISEMP